MGVFTRNYIKSQYGGSGEEFYASRELFDGLEALHKLWFQINELEKRFSGRADDKKENLRADFYVLSEKLINTIVQIYSGWAEGHSKNGWWERSGMPELEMGEGRINRGERGEVDVTPLIKKEVENYINRDINWFDEFWNTEHDYKAAEFLVANINNVKKFNQPSYKDEAEEAIQLKDDRLARLAIDKIGLLDDYYDWSVNNGYFSKHFDLDEIFGDGWWDVVFSPDSHYGFDLQEILENPAVKEEAWKQWLKLWPNYEATLVQVEQIISKLNSVRGTANMNEIMSTISIALNVAHNSGLMYEHLGLNEGDMEDLSNLSTRDWSNEIKQYSRKIVALYNNTKWK